MKLGWKFAQLRDKGYGRLTSFRDLDNVNKIIHLDKSAGRVLRLADASVARKRDMRRAKDRLAAAILAAPLPVSRQVQILGEESYYESRARLLRKTE